MRHTPEYLPTLLAISCDLVASVQNKLYGGDYFNGETSQYYFSAIDLIPVIQSKIKGKNSTFLEKFQWQIQLRHRHRQIK